MADRPEPADSRRDQLLRCEETIHSPRYEEYRMNLQTALSRAERNERWTFNLGWISFLLALILMFVGGSKVVGAFDPTDTRANPLSITLGIIYFLANITWPLALASHYSRFRPIRLELKGKLRDAEIADLKHEVAELRRQLEQRKEG